MESLICWALNQGHGQIHWKQAQTEGTEWKVDCHVAERLIGQAENGSSTVGGVIPVSTMLDERPTLLMNGVSRQGAEASKG